MTYCSQILHEKEEKIKTLEKEIQQLKEDNSEITMEREVFLERNRLLQMQVETAKTILKEYSENSYKFSASDLALKFREVLGGETTNVQT